MKYLKIAGIGVFLLAISAIATYVVATSIFATDVSADVGRSSGDRYWRVNSISEAEDVAGFPVAVPKLPEGAFALKSVIVISGSVTTLPKHVMQVWGKNDESPGFIIIDQDSGLSGLGNGEKISIDGMAIEKADYPATELRPYRMLALFSKGKTTTYTVVASVVDDIAEEVALQVLQSLQ